MNAQFNEWHLKNALKMRLISRRNMNAEDRHYWRRAMRRWALLARLGKLPKDDQ